MFSLCFRSVVTCGGFAVTALLMLTVDSHATNKKSITACEANFSLPAGKLSSYFEQPSANVLVNELRPSEWIDVFRPSWRSELHNETPSPEFLQRLSNTDASLFQLLNSWYRFRNEFARLMRRGFKLTKKEGLQLNGLYLKVLDDTGDYFKQAGILVTREHTSQMPQLGLNTDMPILNEQLTISPKTSAEPIVNSRLNLLARDLGKLYNTRILLNANSFLKKETYVVEETNGQHIWSLPYSTLLNPHSFESASFRHEIQHIEHRLFAKEHANAIPEGGHALSESEQTIYGLNGHDYAGYDELKTYSDDVEQLVLSFKIFVSSPNASRKEQMRAIDLKNIYEAHIESALRAYHSHYHLFVAVNRTLKNPLLERLLSDSKTKVSQYQAQFKTLRK